MSTRAISPLVLVFAAFVLLSSGSLGVGVTWDETIYFEYSDSLLGWVDSANPFAPETLARYWGLKTYLNPHPPFLKILDAASAFLFGDWLLFPLLYRLGHFVYLALLLGLAFHLLSRRVGQAQALLALGFAFLQPRVFGEMLIATTDGPVAVAWFTLVVLAWRTDLAERGSERAFLRTLFFLVYTSAVCTKFTGLLAIVPIGAFFLWRRNTREMLWAGAAVPLSLAVMVLISPDKWTVPYASIIDFLTYPFSRSGIPIITVYFDVAYPFDLPWHYFLVMTAITVPVVIWLCIPGVLVTRREDAKLVQATLFSLAFWMAVVHLPATPRHDGVRQFVGVFPLIGLLSWTGIRGVLDRLGSQRRFPSVSVAAPTAIALILALQLYAAHPHELSFYNRIAGGARGAELLGMEMSYFFESIDQRFLGAMNRTLRPGDKVYMIPRWPPLIELYQAKRLLRRDFVLLPHVTSETPDYFVVLRRRGIIDDAFYAALETIHETTYDGVSLAKLGRARIEKPEDLPDVMP